MIFDLEQCNKGEWFPFFESRINEKGKVEYDDPKPDAGRVCIRSISSFLQERIGERKRKYEFVFNPETRAMERVGYYDEIPPAQAKKESDDVWEYAITGLENFTDKSGKPIECTRENIIKLMSIPMFDRFVGRCLQLLSNANVVAKDEADANLNLG